jgi:F-type H+-transporting ATPase subunit c
MEVKAIAYLTAGFSAALTVIGGAFGIGKLSSSAMEASGRQPEAAKEIRTSMVIAAALIEGISLFSLVICIVLAFK